MKGSIAQKLVNFFHPAGIRLGDVVVGVRVSVDVDVVAPLEPELLVVDANVAKSGAKLFLFLIPLCGEF